MGTVSRVVNPDYRTLPVRAVVDSGRVTTARSIVSALAVAVAVGSLAIRLVGAWWGLPIMTGDQVLFMPVAYEWLARGHFAHPFWAFPGTASNLYNWHGWAFPLVVGWFPTSHRAETLMFGATVLSVLSVATFAVYARVVQLRWAERATLLLLISAIALYQVGRPESLLTIFWGAVLIGQRRLRGRHFDALAAVLLGGTIITQPTIASAAFLIFALHAGCTCSDLRCFVRRIAMVAGGALLVAVGLTVVCSPLTLHEWYLGLRANTAYVVSRSDGGLAELVRYWGTQPSLPLAGIYLVLAALVAPEWWATPRTRGLRWATFGAAALLGVFILLMALRIPATVYNFVAMAPVIAAVSVHSARRAPVRMALDVGSLAAAAGLVFGALSVVSAATGTSIADLQAALRALQPCAIAPDAGSWLAVAEAIGERHICPADAPCASRLIVQASSGLLEPPPQLLGQALIDNHFHRAPPGVGHTRKDYAYALYGDLSRCAD